MIDKSKQYDDLSNPVRLLIKLSEYILRTALTTSIHFLVASKGNQCEGNHILHVIFQSDFLRIHAGCYYITPEPVRCGSLRFASPFHVV